MVQHGDNVDIVEWDDMNKVAFYSYGVALSSGTRILIYPTQLIKTRLQGQTKGAQQYNGMHDAMRKIYRKDGFRGFYKGLHVNLMQVPMAQVYLSVFESSKQYLSKHHPKLGVDATFFIAGGTASTVAQSIATPLDVIAQYQQVRTASNVASNENITSQRTFTIVKQLFQTDGIKGFYRGFTVATFMFGVNSAFIWLIYFKALDRTSKLAFFKNSQSTLSSSDLNTMTVNRALHIMLSGTLASCTVNMALVPLDTIRTRHQLQLKQTGDSQSTSLRRTFQNLWAEEGLKGLWRGWTPRLVQALTTSGILFLSYEYLKTMSYRKQQTTTTAKNTH